MASFLPCSQGRTHQGRQNGPESLTTVLVGACWSTIASTLIVRIAEIISAVWLFLILEVWAHTEQKGNEAPLRNSTAFPGTGRLNASPACPACRAQRICERCVLLVQPKQLKSWLKNTQYNHERSWLILDEVYKSTCTNASVKGKRVMGWGITEFSLTIQCASGSKNTCFGIRGTERGCQIKINIRTK